MNVTEFVQALHENHVSSAPDLDRIIRQGHRYTVRRRAAVAAVVAVVVALIAAPVVTLSRSGTDQPSPGGGARDDSSEAAFETTAPIGVPLGGVAQANMSFYLSPDHLRSVGDMAFWHEAGTDVGELAYGARLVGKDGTLRRAGYLRVPVLPRSGGELVRVPGQTDDAPSFVGLVRVPAGATASDYRVRVHSTETLVRRGRSTTVVDGYLLVWVNALAGGEPGVADLDGFSIRDASGAAVARGTFQP